MHRKGNHKQTKKTTHRLGENICINVTGKGLVSKIYKQLWKLRSWHLLPSLHVKQMGKQWKQWQTLFWGGSKITADGDCSHEIKRCLLLRRKVMTNLDSISKSRDIANKGPYSQGYGFSSSHVWMWELDYKESWAPKNWCFLNCGVGGDSWESLGLQEGPTSQS